MIHDQRVVVFMPAYNAERTLEKTFAEIPFDFVDEVILVDDASRDGTVELGCFVVISLTDLDNYLATVPQTYLPIAEHVMGFAQLELTSPRQMIYVYSNPAERDFRPWEVKTIPNLGEFHTVAREDLENNRFGIESGKAYTFFFKDQNSEATVNYLTRVLGKEIAPKSYLNREGQVILLSYAFGD